MTASLFTTTLIISFMVVGMPHLLPCPVDHKTRVYADGEMPGLTPGTQRRRRRRKVGDEDLQKEGESGAMETQKDNDLALDLPRRGCPVPKPSGLVGQILGFSNRQGEAPPVIKVEKFVGRIRKDTIERKDSSQ
jgi:cytochrome c oxidase assembly factor 2